VCCAAQKMLRIGQADEAEMESDASTRHDELRFTLHAPGGQAVDPMSVVEPTVLQAAIEAALGGQHPLAAMYVNDEQAILARIPVTDVAFLHGLRDKVLEGRFAVELTDGLRKLQSSVSLDVKVDLSAFVELYERSVVRLDKLTKHQQQKRLECNGHQSVRIEAPAGGGKTFIALHEMLGVLQLENAAVLFVAPREALAVFVASWIRIRLELDNKYKSDEMLCRLWFLFLPFDQGVRRASLSDDGSFKQPSADEMPKEFSMVVVDEGHHIYNNPAMRETVESHVTPSRTRRIVLADVSQSLGRDIAYPPAHRVVELTEVVRCSKRIVQAASVVQLGGERKLHTQCHHKSDGPPVKSFLFELAASSSSAERFHAYAERVMAALEHIANRFPRLELRNRVAILVPDAPFLDGLKPQLMAAFQARGRRSDQTPGQQYNLIEAREAASALRCRGRSGDGEALVLDTIGNFDGLERLIVIAVGLDAPLDKESDDAFLETRSRLYRALTRAHMLAMVVNEAVRGGLLEWLNLIKLKEGQFDPQAELARINADAAEAEVKRRLEIDKALQAAIERRARARAVPCSLTEEEHTRVRSLIDRAVTTGGQSLEAAADAQLDSWCTQKDALRIQISSAETSELLIYDLLGPKFTARSLEGQAVTEQTVWDTSANSTLMFNPDTLMFNPLQQEGADAAAKAAAKAAAEAAKAEAKEAQEVESEARRKAQEVESEARRKAQEEEDRRRLQEGKFDREAESAAPAASLAEQEQLEQRVRLAAAARLAMQPPPLEEEQPVPLTTGGQSLEAVADAQLDSWCQQLDHKVLVAWLRDTCRLPEDELVSVADIFLEEKFRTVSQIEALQGRHREHWPEKLSNGHRVSIDDAVLRTRQPQMPPAPPPSLASSSSREIVDLLAQRCHEPDADVEDVIAFFEAIRLQQYVPMLRERDVDGPLLLYLVEQGMESLKELVPNNLDAIKVRAKLRPHTTIMSSTASSLPHPLLPETMKFNPLQLDGDLQTQSGPMIEELVEMDDADLAQEMDDADIAQALALSMLKPSRHASETYRLPSVSDLPEATLTILLKVLSNVIENPENPRFRSLHKTNKALSQNLFPHQDAVAFLCACGFEESNEGVQLPEGADLKLVDEALNSVRAALGPAGKSAVDQIMEAVKGAGAFSAGGSVSDLAPPAAELAVWRRQQGLGIVGFIFEGETPHALLELGTRVLDIGAVVEGSDSPVYGTVVGWTTAQGRFYDTSAGCSNKNGCVRVYYDKKPSAHDGNPWNVMAANRLLFLDAAAPDPPYDTLTRSRPPEAKGDYGGKFGVGSRVRVKKSVSAPAYGWGGVEHGMEGVVIKIDSDGDLKVDFPGYTGWSCKASEMEAVGGDGGGMGGGTGSRTGGGHSAPSKRDTTQREHLKMQKSQMMQMLQMARIAHEAASPASSGHASVWAHGAPHPDLRIGVRVRDSRSGVCGYVLGWVHKGVHYGDVSGGLESGGERGARVRFDRTTQEIPKHEWNLDARRLEFITGDLNNIFMAAAESVTRLEALLNSPECNPNVQDASGASPLWHACRAGSLECTRLLLERRADVQIQPRGKLSPLGEAARNGFVVCVQLLLEHGANMEAIDDEQTTPLFAAVRGAHSSCVEALVNARANLECKTKPLECTPLGWLCCVEPNLNLPILQMLLQGRANVDTYQFDAIARSMSPLHFAVLGDRTDAVKWLLANGANIHALDADGDPPVLVACVADHPECCRLLLGAKADANTTKDDGTTLLNAAAHGGSTECVQLLLEHGAAQTINKMDRIGTHAMHWACQDAYPKILELLCKAKADVENKNGKGGSPLLLALTYEEVRKDVKLECVRILIEHKVDVNAIDPRDGESPLGFVSKKGSIEAAALLLKAGATATIGHKDHRGAHPMHWACQEANPPLLKLLIEAKGNVEQPNGKGGTPLMLATCDPGPRNVECLRMLLKAKADPNQLDHDGDPAIIRTMIRDDEAQSAALLEAGARANATDHHGISLVQRFGALAQPKMLRLLIQHGADVSGVLDLVQVGFSSGMVKKPVEAQNEVLQLLRDAPSVRARFLEEQPVKEQAEAKEAEAQLAAEAAAVIKMQAMQRGKLARRKAQEEEERRRRQEHAAAERRRANDRKGLVAWLRDTCRLPEDELVSVADIFLEEKFRTVSQIEALQGLNLELWPEKLSKGHRVSIDEAVLRTRQPLAPPHDDTVT